MSNYITGPDGESLPITCATVGASAPHVAYMLDEVRERVTAHVVDEVAEERVAQFAKWGEQNHEDGTGVDWAFHADMAKFECDKASLDGEGNWVHILLEEVYEALAEDDPAKLRAELVQVAAVAVAWVEAIDRRGVRQ